MKTMTILNQEATEGAEDQISVARDLDNQLGCGFIFFLSTMSILSLLYGFYIIVG